jgi:7-cyano-7-deazaguanine synthase
MKKAVILLSGGLDSATVLALAKQQNFELYCLSFSYGQRHEIELEMAKKIANFFSVKEHKITEIDLRIFGGSALTSAIEVPKNNDFKSSNKIPITYVPARNTIFLSYALAYAEVIASFDIFIGVNSIDYSGYPDCRADYIKSFEKMANLATASSLDSKNSFKIHTPLIFMNKKEIIKTGMNFNVDFSITHSCYDPKIISGEVISCGQCDSCILRLAGFKANNLVDPIKYWDC